VGALSFGFGCLFKALQLLFSNPLEFDDWSKAFERLFMI
jgi:hypothetical protein